MLDAGILPRSGADRLALFAELVPMVRERLVSAPGRTSC
jgi:hypothetical protein